MVQKSLLRNSFTSKRCLFHIDCTENEKTELFQTETGFLGKELFVEIKQASFIVILIFLLLKIILFIQLPYLNLRTSFSFHILVSPNQTSHNTPRLPSHHKQFCILIPDIISMLRIETYRVYFYWFCLLSLLRIISAKVIIRMANNIKHKTVPSEALPRSLPYFQNRNYRCEEKAKSLKVYW